MATCIFATDVHGNKALYEKLFAYAEEHDAAVILGGDLCPSLRQGIEESISMQRRFLVEYFLPRIEKLQRKPYVIMGNDDCRINADVLQSSGAVHFIQDKPATLDGCTVIGYPFVPVTPFRMKDWEKADLEQQTVGGITTVQRTDYGTIREDLRKLQSLAEPAKMICVFHTPPKGTKLDVIQDGRHVGSEAVRVFIEEVQPMLTLHGHIHESPRMSGAQWETLGHTVMVNPGSYHHPEKPLPKKLPVAVFSTETLPAVRCAEL